MCRWLLQAQDAANKNVLRLTHEALSRILGVVRRTSVSGCAIKLQEDGLIA